MSTAGTDFLLASGKFYQGVYVTVRDVSNFPINHAAIQNLTPQSGVSLGAQNNNGGRYGWVSFGTTVSGKYYLLPPQPLSYMQQVFLPSESRCTVCRIWLIDGVEADIVVNWVSDFTLVLGQVMQILTRLSAGILLKSQ